MTSMPKPSIANPLASAVGQISSNTSVNINAQANQANTTEGAQANANTDEAAGQQRLQILLTLEAEMRRQRSVSALSIWVVNELRSIVDYSQCVFLRLNKNNKSKVQSVSSLANVDRHSPFILMVEQRVDERLAVHAAITAN